MATWDSAADAARDPARHEAAQAAQPSTGPMLALQRAAGNRAVSALLACREPTVQRWLRVASPRNRFFTPAQAEALAVQFVAILTRVSTANTYGRNGNRMTVTPRPGLAPSMFDTRMREWIADNDHEIPLLLVRSTSRMVGGGASNPVQVDSIQEGYVDVGDLAAESDDSVRMNILHLVAERRAVPNYARMLGSSALESDAVFNPAHRAGLLTERDYLRDRLHDQHIADGVTLPGQPLRFRFVSTHGYSVLHTLPDRAGGNVTAGRVEVLQGGQVRTIDEWLALHPAGFP